MSNSRIARKPIIIPKGVDVNLQGTSLTVKGPKGQMTVDVHPYVLVAIENNELKISANPSPKEKITGALVKLSRAIVGTMSANIGNVVHGVSQGFEKKLVMIGVGYRAQLKGKILSLSLGHSHPDDYPVPEGITIETPTQTEVIIKGICKKTVGQVAAEIRSIRPPEPYKGKGVRYSNEKVEIKETKKK